MVAGATIVRGTNDKPAASQALADFFVAHPELDGDVFIGYPIISTAAGRFSVDALYVSPTRGVVVFDLVDGTAVEGYEDRQDDAANKVHSRLMAHRELLQRRDLLVPVRAITFAPAISDRHTNNPDHEYPLVNGNSLAAAIKQLDWPSSQHLIYERVLSAIQNISSIRRPRGGRTLSTDDSRGAKLQQIEDSIATLDHLQSRAVIETVDGVQRIRGLAGSGKTIVLALKAAYLHAQHPEWRMAVTFNTRSLKTHFTRLINNFSIEQTGEEPNWDLLRVVNAWGAPGDGRRDGIYHEFCETHRIDYLDFRRASVEFGRDNGFEGACRSALEQIEEPTPLYDMILIDEAQDFPPEFLRLCYSILDGNKRLVYAYDELQNLSGAGLPPADVLFGTQTDGTAKVSFDQLSSASAARDIILDKCYRNSRPVLVTAHGLGFGVNRTPPRGKTSGLVQMFDQPHLWTDIGYAVRSGELAPGRNVTLARTPETSPEFLEAHSPTEDIVQFLSFPSERDQSEWVAAQVEKNLDQDELRHDDIIVINTDPLTTRRRLGPVRKALLDRRIMSHIAGVDTSTEIFFRPDDNSITCTGIFRAKGNEAGMVYVINAQECHSSAANLARVRNRLFTAITRSKGWVRVTGIGSDMDALSAEYERLKDASFELRFRYPAARELSELQIVHRDMSVSEQRQVESRRNSLADLVEDLEQGRLFTEDLDPDVLQKLRRYVVDEDNA